MLPLPTADPLAITPGMLLAWDPVKQEARWKVPYASYWNGGVLSTAGNLVFEGTADGHFAAYDAENGNKLWDMAVNTGVMAAPATYVVNGKQYVSVLAGWGGSFALIGGNPGPNKGTPGRLLTFALDGKGSLPAPPAPAGVPAAITAQIRGRCGTIEAGTALRAGVVCLLPRVRGYGRRGGGAGSAIFGGFCVCGGIRRSCWMGLMYRRGCRRSSSGCRRMMWRRFGRL